MGGGIRLGGDVWGWDKMGGGCIKCPFYVCIERLLMKCLVGLGIFPRGSDIAPRVCMHVQKLNLTTLNPKP